MTKYNQDSIVPSLVQEAAISYGAPTRYNHLRTILGGSISIKSDMDNDMDLINLTRIGLPKKSLDSLATKLGISMERLSGLLHISHRTLQRKNPSDTLSVHVSEQVLSIAELVRRGEEVLGSESALKQWLHSDLASLNHAQPIQFLDTSLGTSILLKMLGRIEHGVF